MPDIRIVIDPCQEGHPSASDLVVESEADYYAARRNLRQALADDTDLVVWVRSECLATRFDDLSREPRVVTQRYDLRNELAAALGAAGIPEIITPEIIREFDLVAKARSRDSTETQSTAAWCIRALLGDLWTASSRSPGDLQTILLDLATDDRPSLRGLLAWRLGKWADAAGGDNVWRWLADNPVDHARCLLGCMAVGGYGDMAIQWLTQAGFDADTVRRGMELAREHTADPAPIPSEVLASIIRSQLPRELGRRLVSGGVSALDAATARTEAEQRAVLGYLRERAQQGHLLTANESDQIASWSQSCTAGPLSRQLTFAASLLAERDMPPPLPADASWSQAVHWIERHYMPAYAARAVSGRLEETSDAVASFEDWLCDHYQSLMQETEAGLQWTCARAERLAEDALVVLVLLDGVPLPVARWLKQSLGEEEGVSVASERVYLAPLPTLTRFGKPVLLSARLPDQARAGEVDALVGTFAVQPASCQMAEKIGDLAMLRPGRVVLHHFRTVDRDLLHSPMASLDRWIDCHTIVAGLAEDLKALVRKARAEGVPLWLCCASDHGWTELPDSAVSPDLPSSLDEAAITHRRAIAGTADGTCGIPLPRARFFLPDDFTVARGYTYFGRRPHGAVHGGATPQEIAVYGFWVTTAAVEAPQDLVLQIVGEVRRAVKHNEAALRLTNTNPESVVVSEINLERVSVSPNRLPLAIRASGSEELGVICDASGCGEAFPVSGTVSWQTTSGMRRTQRMEFSVPTRGAATTDREFEDMFEV